jgi:hypothetical protein
MGLTSMTGPLMAMRIMFGAVGQSKKMTMS